MADRLADFLCRVQVQSARVPQVDGGWFRAWLVISTASLKTLENVPGVQNGRLHLRVSRKDRTQARELATFASLRLCERDLMEMQGELGAK